MRTLEEVVDTGVTWAASTRSPMHVTGERNLSFNDPTFISSGRE